MINVVSSEFYKIVRSRIFYIISIILFAMFVLFFGFLVYKSSSPTPDIKEKITGLLNYQEVFSGDIIFYLILIFAACLITTEYANGSIRQMACHGIARWKLVLGQYIAISTVSTIILLTFGILNLISGAFLFQLGDFDAIVFIRMSVGMICMFWGMTGIGIFIAYLFKNGGIAVAISVLLVIFQNVIVYNIASITNRDEIVRYNLNYMRKIIIDFTSKPEDVINCSIAFLLIALVTVFGSVLLFSKRDVD